MSAKGSRWLHTPRFSIRLEWKPQDWWIGVYVGKPFWEGPQRNVDVWICPMPLLPIHLNVTLKSLV